MLITIKDSLLGHHPIRKTMLPLDAINAVRVVTWRMAPVRDVESLIDPDDSIQVHYRNLNGKVEKVEACFGVIPSRVGERLWEKPNPRPERSTKREEHRGENDDPYLCPESSGSELIHAGLFGDDNIQGNKNDREECGNCEVDLADQLDLTINIMNRRGPHVKALDCSCDEGCKHGDDGCIIYLEHPGEPFRPPKFRMLRPHDSLGEDEVHNKEEEDTCSHEDLGCNGDWDVRYPSRPDDAHDAGCDSCHAETEKHPRHEELLPPSSIDLQNCHVDDCSQDEEQYKDCENWVIQSFGRRASQGRDGWRVGSMARQWLWRSQPAFSESEE